eukprot:CAMPEP_0185853650 /NCGR_PEP_ID=MMETSP1354-20130828/19742_1 /TAXON_ID=708628 /ORGANISM="Erythrolobus madagascarensis, Strain CCMP3276" /LENGTH=69 /DNA_ID=CAMNT_0028555191 /DNA_START=93 /DNA_END=299 /DNA_ORIENTATION=-
MDSYVAKDATSDAKALCRAFAVKTAFNPEDGDAVMTPSECSDVDAVGVATDAPFPDTLERRAVKLLDDV